MFSHKFGQKTSPGKQEKGQLACQKKHRPAQKTHQTANWKVNVGTVRNLKADAKFKLQGTQSLNLKACKV